MLACAKIASSTSYSRQGATRCVVVSNHRCSFLVRRSFFSKNTVESGQQQQSKQQQKRVYNFLYQPTQRCSIRNISSNCNKNISIRTLPTIVAAVERQQRQCGGEEQWISIGSMKLTAAVAAMFAAGMSFDSSFGSFSSPTSCDASSNNKKIDVNKKESSDRLTPRDVAQEDFEQVVASHDIDKMPIYTSEEVAKNNGEGGSRVWMSYGGVVYDVTDFIPNHPGGAEKILTAAGSSIEPFWHVYRQHYSSDLPVRLMEHMAIGRLDEKDQAEIDEQLAALQEGYSQGSDPYDMEPMRHGKLVVHSHAPFNAECPSGLLMEHYLTPNSLFFIRNHHPVPNITKEDVQNGKYKLHVDLSACGKGQISLTMNDLEKMEKESIVATVQCAANRRGDFNDIDRTSGTPWGQGAISTAKWGGVRLSTILKMAGFDDAIGAEESGHVKYVRFHAVDGMTVSIPIEKAMNPYGDCLVCYEMNEDLLPRDHGYPLRMIIPGYAGVRNIKWINRIELANTEEGTWQLGLNYKLLPPGVTDTRGLDLNAMPSINEGSVYSGITKFYRASASKNADIDTNTNMMKVKGWAYAGGGRNVVRVDVTGDGGTTWKTANVTEGGNQRTGRAWGWIFWECELPCVIEKNGHVYVGSRAVDSSFNVQPESCRTTWNVRGLGNNSWFWQKLSVRRMMSRKKSSTGTH